MRSSGKIKRITALCFCAVLLSAVLCGCTGGNADNDTSSSSETQRSEGSTSSTVNSASGTESETNNEPSESYDTTVTYSEDTSISNAAYASTGTDENAILVTEGNVALDGITVKRNSADSTGGDNSSFYGVGAAILAKGGTTTISNAEITTDAKGGAGVFAYGEGIVKISGSTISTTQSTSGGIHAAGGGTLYATNVTATTQGESSAAIRSDRGGGLMVVSGGDYTSNGTGSPAIYCTATIAVENAQLAATSSEAICIEGLNSLYLYDCDLTGNMPDQSQNDCTWNVILYQSMSGDSKVGNSTFQMTGGKLTAKNGGMFYTTNTESTFILKDVEIVYADNSDFFFRCTGNKNQRGWGNSGANGASSTFTAIDQDMIGSVIWDSISELDFYMTDGSTLTGAFVQDESCAGNGGSGYANLYIDKTSTWTVNGDSFLTALYNAGTIIDTNGKEVTVKGSDGTVYVEGTSEFTITVSTYDTSAELSGVGTITAFDDAQVNNGYQADGGMGGGPGGMGEPSGAPPEMPGGSGSEDTPPDKPDGEPGRPGNGEAPPDIPGGTPENGIATPDKPDISN